MRYLKTYESFDDKRPSNQTKLIDDIEDIFLDLSDNGFEVDLSVMNYTPPMLDDSLESLVVDLVPLQMEFFRWSDIKDVIERLEEYCFRKDEGYGIDVEVDGDYMHIDRFIDIYGREELNRIHLYIYSEDDYGDLLNQKEMNESIYMDYDTIDDIKDILSEFSDVDIDVDIDVRPDENIIIRLDTQFGQNNFSHNTISPDRIDKIEMNTYGDCLLRLIDYLKDRDYSLVTFTNTSDNQQKVYNGFSGKYKDSTIEYLLNIPKSSQIKLYFTYKAVKESNEMSVRDIKDDIKDILCDLTDGDKFNLSFHGARRGIIDSNGFEIKTKDMSYPGNRFDIREIQDYILRLVDYFKSIGCSSFDYGITADPATSIETNLPIKPTRLNNGRIVFVDNQDNIYYNVKSVKLWFKQPKVNESNQFKGIITKDEFPTEDDLKDFFFDLIDELPYCDLKISMSGYVSFSTDNIYRTDITSQMLYDMSFEDDWMNKECDYLQDTWKGIFLPIEEHNRTGYHSYEFYPVYIKLELLDNDGIKFEDKFYENITNGNIPAYPFIELERIYFDVDDKDKLNTLNESLRRLYEATGFRPVGNFHTEDFVDEDSGEIVNLYIANIKLFKVTDVEYKSLIKSKVVVDNPDNEQNKEMTKKFL